MQYKKPDWVEALSDNETVTVDKTEEGYFICNRTYHELNSGPYGKKEPEGLDHIIQSIKEMKPSYNEYLVRFSNFNVKRGIPQNRSISFACSELGFKYTIEDYTKVNIFEKLEEVSASIETTALHNMESEQALLKEAKEQGFEVKYRKDNELIAESISFGNKTIKLERQEMLNDIAPTVSGIKELKTAVEKLKAKAAEQDEAKALDGLDTGIARLKKAFFEDRKSAAEEKRRKISQGKFGDDIDNIIEQNKKEPIDTNKTKMVIFIDQQTYKFLSISRGEVDVIKESEKTKKDPTGIDFLRLLQTSGRVEIMPFQLDRDDSSKLDVIAGKSDKLLANGIFPLFVSNNIPKIREMDDLIANGDEKFSRTFFTSLIGMFHEFKKIGLNSIAERVITELSGTEMRLEPQALLNSMLKKNKLRAHVNSAEYLNAPYLTRYEEYPMGEAEMHRPLDHLRTNVFAETLEPFLKRLDANLGGQDPTMTKQILFQTIKELNVSLSEKTRVQLKNSNFEIPDAYLKEQSLADKYGIRKDAGNEGIT